MTYIYQNPAGHRLFEFEELPSTNDKLRELWAAKEASHGAVVRALFQSKGRGQSGNTWESEKGRNLLISLLIEPSTFSADEQVYINLFACLSVFDFVNACFPGRTRIKWPNDIYVDDKKIAGLLIENSLQGAEIRQSIIGIGININQDSFVTEKAVSFSMLSRFPFNLDECLHRLLECLNKRYAELSLHLKYKLMEDYTSVMYKRGEKAFFKVNGSIIEGEIGGIDASGRLSVTINGNRQLFANKEIEYL